MKLVVHSWNILHIVHELNYCLDSSPVLDEFKIVTYDTSGEQKRILDIYNTISKKLSKETCFCLQEVPGDLFDMLTKLEDYTVYGYKYSREPFIRNTKIKNPYKNTHEYLVTIVHNDIAKLIPGTRTIQFSDPGKAAFIVNINLDGNVQSLGHQDVATNKHNGVDIINMHAPSGNSNVIKALTKIGNYIKSTETRFIIVGDMNCRIDDFKKSLEIAKFSNYLIPEIIGNTRKSKKEGRIYYNKIDHVVTSDKIIVNETSVIDIDNLSDHYIIGVDMIIV